MDAPELTQPGGWKARSHLIGLAGGREVAVEPVALDCYGRIVARVWLGSIDLSERMVRDGFARGINDWQTDYGSAEFYARRRQQGLWAGPGISDPAAHRRSKSAAAPR
jgi:endonuclease YncB( thermonuclease family)